jgi:hypothetical protein
MVATASESPIPFSAFSRCGSCFDHGRYRGPCRSIDIIDTFDT